MEEIGERRRSARLSALENTMKAQQITCEEYDAYLDTEEKEHLQQGVGVSESEPESGPKKRGRKKRKLRPVDEVLENGAAKSKGLIIEETKVAEQIMQGNDNSKRENRPSHNAVYVRRSAKPPEPEMPEKRLLKLVIDTLQRRDKIGVFAEPVDPTEVPFYYEIIQEPMDFFTLKEKLEQGDYKSLEDFESDTFLIFNNAMLFNPDISSYYIKAEKLKEIATEVFHDLRTDPDNFASAYSLPRKRLGGKANCEAKSAGHTDPDKFASESSLQQKRLGKKAKCENKSTGRIVAHASKGSTEVRGSNASGARHSSRPFESFLSKNESLVLNMATCSKSLILAEGEGVGYRDSLLQFSKGMGPTTKKVVDRKLERIEARDQAPARPQSAASGLIPNSTSNVPESYGSLNNSAVVSNSDGDKAKSRMKGIRDLNLPVDGMTKSGSFLSLKVNPSRSDSDVKASNSTVASQARLLEIGGPSPSSNNTYSFGSSSLPFHANNSPESSSFPFLAKNSSGLCSLPFQAKTALIPNQVPISSVPGSEFQVNDMIPQHMSYSYGENSSQQASFTVSELSIPSLQLGQSLHGETQSQSQSYASVGSPQAGFIMEGRCKTSRVYPSVIVPDSRSVASSSQTVKNQYNGLARSEHPSLAQSEGIDGLFRQSNGTTSFPQTRSKPDHPSLGQNRGRAGLFPQSNGITSFSPTSVNLYNSGEGNQTMARTSQMPGPTSSQRNTYGICPPWNTPNIYFRDVNVAAQPSTEMTTPAQPSSPFEWNRHNLPTFRSDAARSFVHVLIPPESPISGIINPMQLNSPPEWGQYRPWSAQTPRNEGIHLQPHINATVNSWNQNSFIHPELMSIGPAGSDASSLQLHGRNVMQNQQSQQNANSAPSNNQQPDISLQL